MVAGVHGSQNLHDMEDDVDAFSEEELARRPEVRLINRYAVLRAYVLMGLKGIGALVLLWATVVLLGGFVSTLKKKDFWYISFIAFVQAGGMFNAVGDKQLSHLVKWMVSAMTKLHSSRVKHNYVEASFARHIWSLLKRGMRSIISKLTAFTVFVILATVLSFCVYGPIICAGLSVWRLGQPDYGSVDKIASQANLKPGMDLFYYLCVAQGIIFVLIVIPVELLGTTFLVSIASRQLGLNKKVVLNYCIATKRKYFNDLASSDESWNIITYGAGLLDSEMPEDNASGARVLTTLIEQGIPVRRLLVRSPRHRIQKLIGSLLWRSPAEGEMRWLASRIIDHIANDLSLAQFPGALECICSLLDSFGYNKDGDQEALHFPAGLRLDKQQKKQKSSEIPPVKLIQRIVRNMNGGTQDRKQVSINAAEGTNEALILQGLRILENLTLDEHNCTVICRNNALFSKIIAPVSSKDLIQDVETNTAWSKVTDGSLKLVSRLMRSPGDTGQEMRHKVADNSRAVMNLKEVLNLEINCSNIVVLQIRAIEILEQLSSGESTSTDSATERREYLITKALNIFLTDKWMEDYLSKLEEELMRQLGKSKKSKKNMMAGQELVKKKMDAAQETANQLKEKAGEALARLCMGNLIDSDYIRSFTGCADVLQYLTEMLDPKKRTIRCSMSAAVILKHLCTHCTLDQRYLKETTLKKVLTELLHIKSEAQATSTSIPQGGNDIENQRGSGHDERLLVQSHYKQQHAERRLQAALLSLCTAIHGRWISAPEFASVVAQLVSHEDLVEKLKNIVEENRYATLSCLAVVKLTCEIVIALIPRDHHEDEVKKKKEIVDSLCQAAETMAGLESCMLFAGTDHDCYGLPLKPFCSGLVKEARKLLGEKAQEMGLQII